jgi:hypothetical protein
MKCRGVMHSGNFANRSDKSCFAFLFANKLTLTVGNKVDFYLSTDKMVAGITL